MGYGFQKWKKSFSRNVKKGEKAIKIIAPTPYVIKEEREKLDPLTKNPIINDNGKIETEEIQKEIASFRVVSVFDVSQTDGKEIPTLVNTLTGDVAQYDTFMEAIELTSPVPISLEAMSNDTDGYFHLVDERIAIRDNMSEVQTVSAAIHEMAHALLHNAQKQEENPKNRNTEEVEAESISYAVCNYYGIETSDNSFGYIANWSKGKDLKELKASLETINTTSSQIITGINKHFNELVKQQDINKQNDNIAKATDDVVSLKSNETPIIDDNLTGDRISTPRGQFSLTTLTKEEMQAQGYGFHHDTDDGKYSIMGNGSRAFAVSNENPLKNAEMSSEQNYNMIDGIINNEPTVADLEKDAKNGKPISVLQLLEATRKEQKEKAHTSKNKSKNNIER